MPAEFKDRLREDLDERYGKLIGVIDEALSTTRKAWADFQCKDCARKQRQQVDIPDIDAALKAAEFLTAHGHGKPGTATAGGSDQVLFVRCVHPGSDDDREVACVLNVAKLFIADDQQDAFLEAVARAQRSDATSSA